MSSVNYQAHGTVTEGRGAEEGDEFCIIFQFVHRGLVGQEHQVHEPV